MQGLPTEIKTAGVCRICGGQLILPSKNLRKISNTWTDENMCRRLDSEDICCACAWFTQGKNRLGIWNRQPAIYATSNIYNTLTIPSFFDVLKSDFRVPAVFIIRGRDPNIIRKHVQWRILDGVTYDREKTKVLYFGINLWKTGSKMNGIAVFDINEMVSLIDLMVETSKDYTKTFLETQKKKHTEWFVQNFTLQNIMNALKNNITSVTILAAYIASYVVADEILTTENK